MKRSVTLHCLEIKEVKTDTLLSGTPDHGIVPTTLGVCFPFSIQLFGNIFINTLKGVFLGYV